MGVRRSLSGTLIGSALPLQLIGAAILPAKAVFGFRSLSVLDTGRTICPCAGCSNGSAPCLQDYRIYGKKLAASGDALAAPTIDMNDAIKLAPQVSA